MQENRNEVISYLNTCRNIFCTVTNAQNQPVVVCIDEWCIHDDTIVIAIGSDKNEMFDQACHVPIAIVAWSKLKGYQIKGKIIPHTDQYSAQIEQCREALRNSQIDVAAKTLVLSTIEEIYRVTPGNQAGTRLFPEAI